MKLNFFILSTLFLAHTYAYDIGEKVKDFSLEGSPKSVSLQDVLGKYIVLEWYNNGCPFVRKHYDSGNIPKMQKQFKDKVNWLTINSSAEGKQGFIKDQARAQELYTKDQMNALALLIDSDGKVGGEFQAKTTPHFFIIDPQGKLVYQGAIDSIASAYQEDIPRADNYVVAALNEALAGKPITHAKTRPYGCSVKY